MVARLIISPNPKFMFYSLLHHSLFSTYYNNSKIFENKFINAHNVYTRLCSWYFWDFSKRRIIATVHHTHFYCVCVNYNIRYFIRFSARSERERENALRARNVHNAPTALWTLLYAIKVRCVYVKGMCVTRVRNSEWMTDILSILIMLSTMLHPWPWPFH